MKKSIAITAFTVAIVAGAIFAATSASNASTSSGSSAGDSQRAKPVRVAVFAPGPGDKAGAGGAGWLQQITLAVRAGVPLEIVRDSIQAFPSFSEIMAEAVRTLKHAIAAGPTARPAASVGGSR